jgi:hypothetical protein
LLCLCDETNDAFQEFYLVPSVGRLRYCVVKRHDKRLKLGTTVSELSHLPTLARRLWAKSTCASDPELMQPDGMRRPVSEGMLYAPKLSTRFEAQEIKETGNK